MDWLKLLKAIGIVLTGLAFVSALFAVVFLLITKWPWLSIGIPVAFLLVILIEGVYDRL